MDRGGGRPGDHHHPDVPGSPISAERAIGELAAGYDAVAFVHGEAATGIVNPVLPIVAEAQRLGIVTIVDAVASVGAEPLDLSGAPAPDIVIIGPQKALAGPAGISAALVNDRGWGLLTRSARRSGGFSSVSLLDIRRDWLESGRVAIPGTPAPHELWALDAAIRAIEEEGLPAVIDRHRRAAAATRAGLIGLGLTPWAVRAEDASGLVTAVLLPHGVDRQAVVGLAHERFTVTLAPTPNGTDPRLLKVRHTGRQASFETVLAAVGALGGVLVHLGHSVDLSAGLAAVVHAQTSEPPGAASTRPYP